MLAQKNRLTQKNEFVRVQKLGKYLDGESFGLGYFNRKDSDPIRFGFVISKSVSPNASKRNYIKRSIDETLRMNMVNIKNGFDCVFVVHPEAAKKYMKDLMPEVVLILNKTKLVK